jgi:hypothetical protein
MPTLLEVLQPNPTAADIMIKARTVGELVLKSEDEVSIDSGTGGHDMPNGSYERAISLAGGPTIKATPCPSSQSGPYYDDYSPNGAYHSPHVVGTFPDHTIVGCDACDRYWKVPYEIKDDEGRATVMTGEPEARVRAFMDPAAAKDALSDPPFNPASAVDDPTPSAEGGETV